jgi:hypothetical protein
LKLVIYAIKFYPPPTIVTNSRQSQEDKNVFGQNKLGKTILLYSRIISDFFNPKNSTNSIIVHEEEIKNFFPFIKMKNIQL